VLDRGRPLDEAFAGAAHSVADERDRAFARNLVTTTLRRLGQIDRLLDALLERPLPRSAAGVRHLLRIGVADMLFLEQAAYAAVHEAVALASAMAGGRFKGLVNAVLRRVAREGAERIAGDDAPVVNTPDWLFATWRDAYGEATARAIATAHLQEPPLDLTAARDPAQLAARLGGQLVPTGSVRLHRAGPIAKLAGYDEGAWWVQDAAAAVPARLLGDIQGRIVFDLCAAPGGKTAQLAAAGARVTAVDISEQRAQLLRVNLARLRLAAEVVIADATTWAPAEEAYAILLDAPCSATGTIRRHPDLPHQRVAATLLNFVPLQGRLLAAAAALVRPGGRLVYSVCSLQPEEGPQIVASLLGGHRAWRRDPISAEEVGGLSELLTPEGDVRTLPCHLFDRGGLDGFYIARLVRH
jgi:16S rRNA (cytosine967-C5)-methyltransferase